MMRDRSYKWLHFSLVALCLLQVGGADAAAPQADSDNKLESGYVTGVEKGTVLSVVLDSDLSSATSKEGDEFSVRTLGNIERHGYEEVLRGALLKGHVTNYPFPEDVKPAPTLQLKFDSIILSNDLKLPLAALLVSRKRYVHITRTETVRGRTKVKKIAIRSGESRVDYGVLIGILAGKPLQLRPPGDKSISVTRGTTVLTAARGKKIELRTGDQFEIELLDGLRCVR